MPPSLNTECRSETVKKYNGMTICHFAQQVRENEVFFIIYIVDYQIVAAISRRFLYFLTSPGFKVYYWSYQLSSTELQIIFLM